MMMGRPAESACQLSWIRDPYQLHVETQSASVGWQQGPLWLGGDALQSAEVYAAFAKIHQARSQAIQGG